MFAAGSLLTFSSFAYASQSLLASLGTLQFISNVVFSSWVLREPLTARVLSATALIVVTNDRLLLLLCTEQTPVSCCLLTRWVWSRQYRAAIIRLTSTQCKTSWRYTTPLT